MAWMEYIPDFQEAPIRVVADEETVQECYLSELAAIQGAMAAERQNRTIAAGKAVLGAAMGFTERLLQR